MAPMALRQGPTFARVFRGEARYGGILAHLPLCRAGSAHGRLATDSLRAAGQHCLSVRGNKSFLEGRGPGAFGLIDLKLRGSSLSQGKIASKCLSTSGQATEPNKRETEAAELDRAKTEAEKRTRIFDEKDLAYNVARGELKDLKEQVPGSIRNAVIRMEAAADESEKLDRQRVLNGLVDELPPDVQLAYSQWLELNAELPGLKQSRDQAFEKSKAADEALKQLRDKEAREAAQDGGRRDSPPQPFPQASEVIFSCDHLTELVPEFRFEFCADDVFKEMCDSLDGALGELFNGAHHPSAAQFPMIKGAAGSGKTRMGVELALHGISTLKAHGKAAVHLFVTLDPQSRLQVEPVDMENNKSLQERVMVRWLLLGLLGHVKLYSLNLEKILLECDDLPFEWTLSGVLRRVKQELKVDLVFVHVDEYKHDLAATFAMFKACERSYKAGLLEDSASLHLIVSGITTCETNGRNNIESLGISGNAIVRRVVLGGDRVVPGLDKEVAHALGISDSALEQCVNFRRVLTDCGGLTRCFEFVVDALKAAPALREAISRGSMSQEEGRNLFKQIRVKLGTRYGEEVWLRVFSKGIAKPALICLRRVLFMAVAGAQVDPGARIHSEVPVTFNQAQDSGLFSLTPTRQVSMPLVAVALFNEWTANAGVVPAFTDSELDPFTYDWGSFEDMALASLRARMNAAFYLRGPCKVGLHELRPGALFNRAARKAMRPAGEVAFDVPAEIGATIQLFQHVEIAGWYEERDTGLDGYGHVVCLQVLPGEAPRVVKTAPRQAGLDGGVASSTSLLWSQSKSRDVASAGSRSLGPADVAIIAAKMLSVHDKVKDKSHAVDSPGPIVLDIFTARVKAGNFRGEAGTSSEVDDAMLSRINDTPLVITTDDCLEECLGPVFAVRIRMLRNLEK